MKIFLLSGLIMILFTTSSCRRLGLCKDEDMTIKRTTNIGNTIKTGGYYYGKADTAYDGRLSTNTIVFYRNGVFLSAGSPYYNSLKDIDNYIQSLMNSDGLRHTKYIWGLYIINDSSLTMQGWQPSFCSYPLIINSVRILNDTTLLFNKVETTGEGTDKTSKINNICKFRELNFKPDSINNFLY
jgi:hypothetical protein